MLLDFNQNKLSNELFRTAKQRFGELLFWKKMRSDREHHISIFSDWNRRQAFFRCRWKLGHVFILACWVSWQFWQNSERKNHNNERILKFCWFSLPYLLQFIYCILAALLWFLNIFCVQYLLNWRSLQSTKRNSLYLFLFLFVCTYVIDCHIKL